MHNNFFSKVTSFIESVMVNSELTTVIQASKNCESVIRRAGIFCAFDVVF